MSYYRTCPYCGAHLDPGEACDCIPSLYAQLSPEDRAQVDRKVQDLLGKDRPGCAANAPDGKVEQSLPDTVSASYDIRETEDLQA